MAYDLQNSSSRTKLEMANEFYPNDNAKPDSIILCIINNAKHMVAHNNILIIPLHMGGFLLMPEQKTIIQNNLKQNTRQKNNNFLPNKPIYTNTINNEQRIPILKNRTIQLLPLHKLCLAITHRNTFHQLSRSMLCKNLRRVIPNLLNILQ